MIIRAACEADAPAMGQVMVTTYLAAHRDQMPEEALAKRAEERPQTGVVYALSISTGHQGQGLVRRLVQAVAAELAHKG